MFGNNFKLLIPAKYLIVFLLYSSCGTAFAQDSSLQAQKQSVYDLFARILPSTAVSSFEVEFINSDAGKDVFEIESKGRKIILRGNNGISVASALNYYLNNYANCQFTWNTLSLKLPGRLPEVKGKVRKVSPYKYRYYLNYCTFNYSMSWWDWDRWQHEIDWMALHGINMPLALTGQNIIWEKVYKSLGFTDRQLENFFSGPAYFGWFWMGNLDRWNGPLPHDWMVSHEKLQMQILERERSLGMTPVLPAFTGHVPPSFKDKFPAANVKTTKWSDFPEVCILAPSDSLFSLIGKKFLSEMIRTYGTDHLYSADTFNENTPPSDAPQFLHDISAQVYKSMKDVDPEAKWIMQGWLFHFSKKFWKNEQIKALLSGVPDDGMIILDLWSDKNPVWNKTDAYYGKPWIWCMLQNFGGNNSLYGQMDHIATTPANTLCNKKAGNMTGIGLTPEAIEQNPVIYELMTANIWTEAPVNAGTWLRKYLSNRYGKVNNEAAEAWSILKNTAYADSTTESGTGSIIAGRPTFSKKANFVDTKLSYDPYKLVQAWDKMLKASGRLKKSDEFRYDLVDLTRQILANYANQIQQSFTEAYNNKDTDRFIYFEKKFLRLMDDMDTLLATRREFLLGTWLENAKKWAQNEDEARIYERNARDLITLWGDRNSSLHDYSWRQWSGLISSFYKVRWTEFFDQAETSLKNGTPFNQKNFENGISSWEWDWVNSQDRFPDKPAGDEITVVRSIYKSYRHCFDDENAR